VLLDVRDGVAIVTLNRPERLNALTPALYDVLGRHLDYAADSPDVGAVIITGTGRGFCSGGDLVGHPAVDEVDPGVRDRFLAQTHSIVRRIITLPKPTVAAANGVAAAAGADLAWACDFRVASAEARFLEMYAQAGMASDFGGTYLLPRLVGMARATEILMLGESISAAQAREWGLVHRVVPPDAVLPAALELARRLAAQPPLAVRAAREALRGSFGRTLETALSFERHAQNLLMGTPELCRFEEGWR